jgi:hypothetical protein
VSLAHPWSLDGPLFRAGTDLPEQPHGIAVRPRRHYRFLAELVDLAGLHVDRSVRWGVAHELALVNSSKPPASAYKTPAAKEVFFFEEQRAKSIPKLAEVVTDFCQREWTLESGNPPQA